jgi:hypothetical protein
MLASVQVPKSARIFDANIDVVAVERAPRRAAIVRTAPEPFPGETGALHPKQGRIGGSVGPVGDAEEARPSVPGQVARPSARDAAAMGGVLGHVADDSRNKILILFPHRGDLRTGARAPPRMNQAAGCRTKP